MISYAEGISCPHAWRFELAALAKIVPASFLLAHVGIETATGELGSATLAVLGIVTGLPLLWNATKRKVEKES